GFQLLLANLLLSDLLLPLLFLALEFLALLLLPLLGSSINLWWRRWRRWRRSGLRLRLGLGLFFGLHAWRGMELQQLSFHIARRRHLAVFLLGCPANGDKRQQRTVQQHTGNSWPCIACSRPFHADTATINSCFSAAR